MNLREIMFRVWYWYVGIMDKNADVLLMNYGYSDQKKEVPLSEEDAQDRYSVQLYHHLAIETELKGKDVVEIGCGRGGGLSYIARNFAPSTVKGIDLTHKSIDFCKNQYDTENLTFEQGDAQELSLANNSFDVVFNVESSHRYPNFQSFINEVVRVLRPGGHFLFTDLRFDSDYDEMRKIVDASGLEMVKERFINDEVVEALELDDARRRELIERLAPKILHRSALKFAGNIGSVTYDRFKNKEFLYFSFVLRKN